MYKYELKKIFTLKKTVLTTIALVAIMISIFLMDETIANFTEIQRLNKIYTGEVTSQLFIDTKNRADEIRENPEYYTDPSMDPETMKEEIRKEFDEYETPEFCMSFSRLRQGLWKDIKNNAEGSSENEIRIANEYSTRMSNLKPLINGDTTSISFLERYIANFLPFIMAFIIAMFVSPLFASEYELKTDSLLLTSRYGKNKLIRAKLFAGLAATSLLYGIVVIGYFLRVLIKWGMFDTKASFIFTVPDAYTYVSSPFEFTMGQYFWVMIAVSFASCIVFCLFTALLSSIMKKTLLVAVNSMIFVFVPFILTKSFGMTVNTFTNILRFNFANMMSVRGLFDEFYAFVIGGHVVSVTALFIPILIISGVGYYLIARWGFKNHQVG